jgi:hypothetical protein
LPESPLPWSATEPSFVSVDIAVGDFAHAIRIRLLLRWFKPPISDLRDECIEVFDEQRVPSVASVFRLLNNE